MIGAVLRFCALLGAFPFRLKVTTIEISKLGLVTNACSVVFLFFQIVSLVRGIIFEVRDQPASAIVGFAMKVVNSGLLVVIFARRRLHVNQEADVLNRLFSVRCGKYVRESSVFLIELGVVIIEYVLYVYIQIVRDENIYIYDLTLLLRLGFESQMLMILVTFESLYEHWNTVLRNTIVDATKVFGLRVKFDSLHELRLRLNKAYSLDLLLYFTSSQLLLLVVCFELIKHLSGSEDAKTAAVVLECLRFARLFVVMAYVIWRWSEITYQYSRTLMYLFEYDAQKLSLSTLNQIELFVEEVRMKNEMFMANKFYDINMPLLYNISGNVFAYLLLMITTMVNEQHSSNNSVINATTNADFNATNQDGL